MDTVTPIPVMINGLPGNVSATIAAHFMEDDRFTLLPFSLTGPEIEKTTTTLCKTTIELIKPNQRDEAIEKIKAETPYFITVDFTHPSAVNANADFYVAHHLPFVMGTTGGNRERLEKRVREGRIAAVIAPNMAKQIVGFQAMMEYAATIFPDLFKGYTLEIKESHQQGKADTSGTAKAMVTYFNKLGIPFSEEEIVKMRDPERQQTEWHIPENHIAGHAWHTYTLTSPEGSALFQFTHNINGRDIYAQGTQDAVLFLHKKISNSATAEKEDNRGKIYTMIDVLKG